MKKLFSGLAVLIALAGAGACNKPPAGDGKLTIAVIPKGTSHVFWQSIHAGAAKAAQELGVYIIWRGPLREDDRASQVSEVEGFVTRGVSGIVLAPLDEAALVTPVADAVRNNIPVVIIDSGLKGNDYVSFVATDNRQGGRLAGEGLAALLPDGGKVVMLRYAEGSASTNEREEGFLEAIRTHKNIDVLSENQYGGADVEGAYKKSEAMLNRFKTPDGTLAVDGVFCPNESTTLAMLRVLEDSGWAGKVKFVGFDASESLVKGLGGRPHRRARRAGPRQDGLPRREDPRLAPERRAGREAHRHRRPAGHPRQDERSRREGASSPRLVAMAEAVVRHPRFAMIGVRKAFGATVALDGVDLAVRPGEVCALVGQNGAGKSTLMAILAGALQPDAGSMTLDGAPYAPADPLEARRAGVAMIYQELSLAPHLSVMENIALGVEPSHFGFIDRARVRQTAVEALRQLGHPEISPEARVGRLSPAAQQLVEIARALAIRCRVLVFDEPTSSLGFEDVRTLFELIARLKQQGLAIAYISHFIEEVKEVSDRFVVLRDGRNAGEGVTPQTRRDEIVNLMVGRTLQDLYPRGARTAGESILEVADLFPGSATFTLHRGEVFGIAGLLGAGRTRLLRALFGLEPVRSGTVRLGMYAGRFSPHERWKQGMGMLSEDRTGEGLALGLSVADNMTLTRLRDVGPGVFVVPRNAGRHRTPVDRQPWDPHKQSAPNRGSAVRRQSAESGARAAAASRRRRARARRADARHRRGQQGADLQAR